MPTILDERQRRALLTRLADLDPEQSPRWGNLTAPAMIAHLCDQLRMALGEHHCAPVPGVWRSSPFRAAFLSSQLMWGKGMEGPPEAFSTPPTNWDDDLATLHQLIERFLSHDPAGEWAEHPNLGRMSRRAWGVFTYRHVHHHLRQFGA